MSPKLIGIIGKKGSGKSTVASYIKDKYNIQEYTLASPLKQIAVILGFPTNLVYGTQNDKELVVDRWGVSSRTFLQKFGTDICRDMFPKLFPNMKFNNIWIELLEREYNKHQGLVISDVRFQDEANFIKDKGGILIKLDRFYCDTDQHQSETELDYIQPTYYIDNNGSLIDTLKYIDEIINLPLMI